MANPVVHFEIGAADDQPLLEFYGELFGWGLRAVPGVNSTLVDTRGGGGINGGIGRSGTGEAWATFYVEVDDPQAFLDRAAALGRHHRAAGDRDARAWRPSRCSTTPTGCWSGWCRAKGHPRRPSGRRTGDGAAVDWFEVLGADAGRSQAFYAELFGWTVPGGAYGQVGPGAAHGIGGGIGAGGDDRLGDGVRRRRRRRGRPGQGRGARGDPRLRAQPGRRPYRDGRVPRPRRQRVRRLPPRPALTGPAFYRSRSLWLDELARRPAGPAAAPARAASTSTWPSSGPATPGSGPPTTCGGPTRGCGWRCWSGRSPGSGPRAATAAGARRSWPWTGRGWPAGSGGGPRSPSSGRCSTPSTRSAGWPGGRGSTATT